MIEKCLKGQENKILSYIGKDYPRCLYLYMNLKKYGAGSDVIDVCFQMEESGICAVFLQYYNCIHVYSRNHDFSAEEFFDWSREHSFSMIYCEKQTADYLWEHLSEEKKASAEVSDGWVAQILSVDREASVPVQKAEQDDFGQIISLIYRDEDIGRSYDYDVLSRQMKERSEEGYGRNRVIRDGATVVAHACTNAELDGLAVVAELVVNPDYRRMGYASEIWRTICSELLSEGKEVFSFYYSEESRALHKKVGFTEVCEWSKIVFET